MRLVLHRSLQTPGIGITEKFGKQQRAGVAFSDRGLQELLDGGKSSGSSVLREPPGEQPFTQACADAVPQFRRYSVDGNLIPQGRRGRRSEPRRSR